MIRRVIVKEEQVAANHGSPEVVQLQPVRNVSRQIVAQRYFPYRYPGRFEQACLADTGAPSIGVIVIVRSHYGFHPAFSVSISYRHTAYIVLLAICADIGGDHRSVCKHAHRQHAVCALTGALAVVIGVALVSETTQFRDAAIERMCHLTVLRTVTISSRVNIAANFSVKEYAEGKPFIVECIADAAQEVRHGGTYYGV